MRPLTETERLELEALRAIHEHNANHLRQQAFASILLILTIGVAFAGFLLFWIKGTI